MNFNLFDPNWTPAQRAAMHSIIIILLGAIITGLTVVSDTLAKGGMVDYRQLGLIAGVTITISFGHGLVTYLMAHNADIAPLVEIVVQQLEKRFGSLVPPSVQPSIGSTQDTPVMQPQAQQSPLVSIHVQSPVQPPQPSQNSSTAPTSVVPIIPPRPVAARVNLVPLPGEDTTPTTLTEVPLQGDIRATAGLPAGTQLGMPTVQAK